MFADNRSKKILLVAHCILNQNSISDNTADFPGTFKEIVNLILQYDVGVVQMPCPELLCLGLDRGDIHGAERAVVVENTRIRNALNQPLATKKLKVLVDQMIFQIGEYIKNGFSILGIIGINRSPSCGIDTTSMNDKEVEGKGVFMESISQELKNKGMKIEMIGVKPSEVATSVTKLKNLLERQ